MERKYTDKAGITHDLEIYDSLQSGETVFTIHRNGSYFVDLVWDEDRWIEPFSGPSERSAEYGKIIDELSVFVGRTFQKTLYDQRQAGA